MIRMFNLAFLTLLSLVAVDAKQSNATTTPKGKSKADKEPSDPVPKGPGNPLIDTVDDKQPAHIVSEGPVNLTVIAGPESEAGPVIGTIPTMSMPLSMSMVADPGFGEWSILDEVPKTYMSLSLSMITDPEFEDLSTLDELPLSYVSMSMSMPMSMVTDPKFEEWSTLDEMLSTSMSMIASTDFDKWAVFEIPAISMSTSMSMVADPAFEEWAVFDVPAGSMSMNARFSMSLSMSIPPSPPANVSSNSKAGKATLTPPSTSPVSVGGKAEKQTQSPVGKALKDPVKMSNEDDSQSDENGATVETIADTTDRTWTKSPLMTSSSQRGIYVTSITTLLLFSWIVAILD
ncbi:hypothetical protein ACHAW6_008319 [Cyclotella cf. meneghiniana]